MEKEKTAESITANEREYLRRKVAKQESAAADLNEYAGHLFAAYGLQPGIDNIHPDGRIVRGKAPKPAKPVQGPSAAAAEAKAEEKPTETPAENPKE
jgi:cell division septation protein DedD